jgi:hypothetical protein
LRWRKTVGQRVDFDYNTSQSRPNGVSLLMFSAMSHRRGDVS